MSVNPKNNWNKCNMGHRFFKWPQNMTTNMTELHAKFIALLSYQILIPIDSNWSPFLSHLQRFSSFQLFINPYLCSEDFHHNSFSFSKSACFIFILLLAFVPASCSVKQLLLDHKQPDRARSEVKLAAQFYLFFRGGKSVNKQSRALILQLFGVSCYIFKQCRDKAL